MKLYYHPLSTYSQKVLMAFYEKGIDFEPQVVNLMDEKGRQEYRQIYPLGKIPLLVRDDDWHIPESSIIIEYLDTHFDSGTRLIPRDSDQARQTRFFDRMNDLYLNETVTTLLFQSWKPEAERDQGAIERARFQGGVLYDYLERHLEERDWMMGAELTMADCAAAPPLFYAQRSFPFEGRPVIRKYWERLQARPSYQRVLAEAQPILEKVMAARAS